MVTTLNMPFSDKDMRVLKKAKDNSECSSWPELFVKLAIQFNDDYEEEMRSLQ